VSWRVVSPLQLVQPRVRYTYHRPSWYHAANTVQLPKHDVPMQCLIDEGFTDVYRLLHSDARRQPGFTHFIDSTTQCSRSRIDYIWTRGASAASHLTIRIDAKLRDISHYRLVWMDLLLLCEPSPPCDRPLYHMKLPNLRDLSPEQQEVFVDHLEKRTIRQEHHLRTLADTLSSSSLSIFARHRTDDAHT
jgi:hypothetical protein